MDNSEVIITQMQLLYDESIVHMDTIGLFKGLIRIAEDHIQDLENDVDNDELEFLG